MTVKAQAKIRVLSREEVIEHLRQRQGSRTLAELGQEFGGIKTQQMNDIMSGRKPPCPKILERLGLTREKVDVYHTSRWPLE